MHELGKPKHKSPWLNGSVAALLASSTLPAAGNLPSSNPFNAVVPQTGWSLVVEDVVTIPNSAGLVPRLEVLAGGGAPGQVYAVDQRGPIWRFDPSAATPTPQLFLDLSSAVGSFRSSGNQTGVRGLAFHPDFNTPGTDGYRTFYTAHSLDPFAPSPGANTTFFFSPPGLNHDSVVGEWRVDAAGNVITSSYRELLRVGQPRGDHNIGQISFNPNAQPGEADYGKLYIPLGDGGGPGDPNNLAQDISTTTSGSGGLGFPHGSILRIDPIATATEAYTVPSDNPFASTPNTIGEIWAYGLRNPNRIAWDPVTDKMLIADIGQANIEEINLGAPGANYGWGEREGTFVSTGDVNVVATLPPNHPTDSFTYPVAQYDHDSNNDNIGDPGLAVAGGFTARGSAVPGLNGLYLFGDFSNNRGPIFVAEVEDLIQRDDFSDLEDLNDGLLAPIVEVGLQQPGNPNVRTLLEIIQDTDPGAGRTDLRFGQTPDGTIYVLNKRDGVVRAIIGTEGLIAGNVDRDRDIDDADLGTMFSNYSGPVSGAAGLSWASGDTDGDGDTDDADLGSAFANYTGPLSPNTVPEPTSLGLLLLGSTALLHRRR